MDNSWLVVEELGQHSTRDQNVALQHGVEYRVNSYQDKLLLLLCSIFRGRILKTAGAASLVTITPL
jgi:hypothetical protein